MDGLEAIDYIKSLLPSGTRVNTAFSELVGPSAELIGDGQYIIRIMFPQGENGKRCVVFISADDLSDKNLLDSYVKQATDEYNKGGGQ